MTYGRDRNEELLDRLVLDAKALALLYGSDLSLREQLRERLVDSHDEQVRRFVHAVQRRTALGTTGVLATALGELALSSVMIIVGLASLAPTVFGGNSAQAILAYLSASALAFVNYAPLGGYISFVEFAISILLLVGAFFTLRQASLSLREAGLTLEVSEE